MIDSRYFGNVLTTGYLCIPNLMAVGFTVSRAVTIYQIMNKNYCISTYNILKANDYGYLYYNV